MPRAEWQFVGNMVMPFPSVLEQSAIVCFLGRIDRRIRRYIRAKQNLIKLLEEEKQVIIHRAVTRGHDPNVQLKPSGVEWLGDVPEHWSVAHLGRLTTRIGDGLHGTPAYVDQSEYRFINGNNLLNGRIDITPLTRCVGGEEFEKHKIELGDTTLLMSINGTVGNLALYCGESVILGKSAAYINCDQAISRDFLFFFLQSSVAKEYFRLEVTGTTIFNLSLASIRKLLLALPSISEQLDICSFLNSRVAEFDKLTADCDRQINLIREYRTRLIADVITGKLDVREAAALLPAEIEEPEQLEEADVLAGGEEEIESVELEPSAEDAIS
jgi:type I restriction enzyme S subunit